MALDKLKTQLDLLKKLKPPETAAVEVPSLVSDNPVEALKLLKDLPPSTPVSNLSETTPTAQRSPLSENVEPEVRGNLELEALSSAENAENLNRLGSSLLASGNLINQGLTLSPVDNRAVEALKPGISAPVEAFKRFNENRANNLKLRSATMDLENEKELNDPNSDISITARNTLATLGMDVPETTSAGTLKAAGVNIGTLIAAREQANARRDQLDAMVEERKLGRDLREEQLKGIKDQREVSNISKIQEGYNKDKLVQKSLDGVAAAEDIRALIKLNNPIAAEAVPNLMARLQGEVGAMTERDVAKFKGSKALIDTVERILNEKTKGDLTEKNKKYLKDVADVILKNRNEQLNNRGLLIAKQASSRLGMPVEKVYELIRPGEKLPQEKVKVISPEGQKGTVPKSKLKMYLEKGYKEDK